MQNIYLTGFMGTGKTAVGKGLSEELGLAFVDIDDLITRKEKRSINQIFTQSQEPYFRKIEAEILREVSSKENQAVSCGGGIVLNEQNIILMKQTGKMICLSAAPEAIFERIKNDTHRPLLQVAEPLAMIRGLLTQRRPYYEQADFMIDTSGISVKETVREIIDKIILA